MNKVSLKAITIGSVTDIALTIILGAIVIVAVLATKDLSGMPASEFQIFFDNEMENNQVITVLTSLTGGIGLLIGGYLSARLANHHELLNAALASFIGVAFVFYSIISGDAEGEYSKHVFYLIGNISLATLGGYLRLRQVNASRVADF